MINDDAQQLTTRQRSKNLSERPCYVADRECEMCSFAKWTEKEYRKLTQLCYKMVDSLTGKTQWSIGGIVSSARDDGPQSLTDADGFTTVIGRKRGGKGTGSDTMAAAALAATGASSRSVPPTAQEEEASSSSAVPAAHARDSSGSAEPTAPSQPAAAKANKIPSTTTRMPRPRIAREFRLTPIMLMTISKGHHQIER